MREASETVQLPRMTMQHGMHPFISATREALVLGPEKYHVFLCDAASSHSGLRAFAHAFPRDPAGFMARDGTIYIRHTSYALAVQIRTSRGNTSSKLTRGRMP